ncbi:MAG: hypothetical protein U0574_06980 [Phycisphaerales bacterium]
MSRTPFALRALIALAALAGAAYHMAWGTASLPLWMANVATRAGVDHQTAVRGLVALELVIAVAVLLRRPVGPAAAVAAVVALAFSGLAELSALMRAGAGMPALVPPGLAVAAAATAIIVLSRGRGPGPRAAAARSPGGPLAALAVAAVAATALAARLPVGAVAGIAAERVAFGNPASWEGRRLPDTGLPHHLPQLTPLTLEGRHVVIFYNPNCSECRELMSARFGAGADGAGHPEVIVVLTPPEAGAVIAAGDDEGPVPCEGCVSLSLPSGPAWFERTPVVLVIQDGVVRCAAVGDAARCLP